MADTEVRRQRVAKKKKRSFLSKERNQAKRGRYGRGTDIGADTFNYFLRILEVKISDFTNSEDKEIFIDNVFEQTAGREVNISCNQLGSVVMEKFLPLANDKILLRFTYTFSKDLRKLCCNEFGSHVLQKLIVVVCTRSQVSLPSGLEEGNEQELSKHEKDKLDSEETQRASPEMILRFKNWLDQACRYAVNNLEEFVSDRYANHVVRSVLECLAGLPPGSVAKRKANRQQQVPAQEGKGAPIEEGTALVQECGSRLLHMPQLIDFVYGDFTCGLLQTILLAIRRIDTKLTRKIVKHLLDICFDPTSEECVESENKKMKKDVDDIPELFKSESATRLMDVMISVASPKSLTQIYARCFINRLGQLSLAPFANFCVQNLVRCCTEKVEFEAMFDELSPHFEALLSSGKSGVLLALCETCQKLGAKQGQFIKELQNALHCVETNERQAMFPLLVTYLVDYETWCENQDVEEENRKLSVSLQGSLMVQTMLNFPETIKLVKMLLDMDIKHLKFLFCDPRGSHIADAFFASKSVGEKSREKLCRKLQGSFVALAISKHGSRVLDAVWAWAPLKSRKHILEELAPSEAVVNSVQWGNIFSEKSGLSLFKRRPKDWEDVQTRDLRTRKLFADIIGMV